LSRRLTLTHPAEDSCGLENHVISNDAILLGLSVDPSDQTSALLRRVEAFRAHKHRSNGGKLIKGLGIEKLASGLLGNLKKSTGDIISDRVPEDAGCGFFGGNIADLAGSDKDQFTLNCVSTLSRAVRLLIIKNMPPNRGDARHRIDSSGW
jgi:hypothetical protein